MAKNNFIYELVKEHIRQLKEEYHIEAFQFADLKRAEKNLRKLEILKDSQQELRLEKSCFNDGYTISFAMLFDLEEDAKKFMTALNVIHPYFKIEK